MRKKFLAMYALVGALVASPIFTSCIDDTESESVTAVRKEAAEKLRIKNQIDAAKAELEMQYDKAYYEAQIAQYEAKLLEFQLTLKQNQDALNAYGIQTLSDLTSAYTSALNNAATTEWNIIKLNNSLKGLNDGYLDAEDVLAEAIENKNADIEKTQAKIDQLNEWIENGAIDKIELDKKIEELTEAQRKLYNDWLLLQEQYGSMSIDTEDVDGNGQILADEYKPTKLAAIEAARKLKKFETDNANTFVNADGNQMSFFYNNAEGYLTLSEEAVEVYKQNFASTAEEAIKSMKAALGTEADTETTEKEEGSGVLTLYAQLAAANKALADAEKALAENEDETQTATLETAVNNAKLTVAVSKDAINHQLDAIAGWENSEDYLAAFIEGYEEYKTAKAALDKADKEWQSAINEENALHSLKNLLNTNESNVNVDGNSLTFAEAIEYYEAEIEEYKAEIADLKLNYSHENINVDSEEILATLVAYYEKQIAIEEVKLATYNKQAEEAKAALDAYLGTEA